MEYIQIQRQNDLLAIKNVTRFDFETNIYEKS